jgi:hypothetical protein
VYKRVFFLLAIAMPAKLYAVLIADVMGSSTRRHLREALGKTLASASKRHLHRKLIRLPYSVTAGDEFQTISTQLSAVPQLVLELRIMLQPLPLRIGIGFGKISDRIQPPVNRLGGEAFQFARHSLEDIKTGNQFKFESLTAFTSSNPSFDRTINLIYGLHDTLVRNLSAKQWETIEMFLAHPTLESTAGRLKLDASTVSRNLKRGYYWQLSETVKVAGSLISQTF